MTSTVPEMRPIASASYRQLLHTTVKLHYAAQFYRKLACRSSESCLSTTVRGIYDVCHTVLCSRQTVLRLPVQRLLCVRSRSRALRWCDGERVASGPIT